MKRMIAIAMMTLALVGCDRQRDLYIRVGPLLDVAGDWMPSIDKEDMAMNATAVAYTSSGVYAKEYFYNPDNVTIPLNRGVYDVMIFNGLMYSAVETHLDAVFFRGIDNFDTFEAVARESGGVRRLSKAPGDYIASNDMEIFTSAAQRLEIDGAEAYHIKYKNGKNGTDVPDSYVEGELEMTPVAMSYECQVIVTIDTISSAYGVDAELRGFVGSAFAASREPSRFFVKHQFNLNNKKIIPDRSNCGTVESPLFVTFGPPVDLPDHTCELWIRVVLLDGEIFEQTVDVTDQLLPVIAAIRDNLDGVEPIRHGIKIVIEARIELPVVEPVVGIIGVDDWGDDEIIHVPITVPSP